MKKLSLFVILFCASLMTMAQDVIVKKDGSTIQSKVMEINGTEIKYKKWSNQDGPMYSIDRSEILSINYQNGEVEKFSEVFIENPPTSDLPVYTGKDLTIEGWRKEDIALNGRILSNDEIKYYLGSEAYSLYLSAKNKMKVNAALTIPFGICMGGTLLCLTLGYGGGKTKLIPIGYVFGGVGVPCWIVALVFSGMGQNGIRDIVADYNKHNNKNVSFHIEPSIIQSNMAQTQGNLGLGFTFSINF